MRAAVLAAFALLGQAASAQTTNIDAFKDGTDEAKVHSASGFVCPLFIGHFERDAYGERDPQAGADFCAYSARDGVYGTIVLTPLKGAYDARTALADEFSKQEGIGGKQVAEKTVTLGGKAPLAVYTRTYETAALETLHYRILFAGGAVGNWAVETTVEFATPRDDDTQKTFLNAVYAEARAHIAGLPPGQSPPAPPLAGPAKPR